MSKPKISAHMLVKNEQNWIWYSLHSILDYVDEVLVWDTGSTDQTVSIINSFSNPKIKFREVGPVDLASFTKIRQQMLAATSADWIFLVDGDEIWLPHSLSQTCDFIAKHPDIDCLVHPFINCLGDVYHYQPRQAGKYHIGDYSGHVTIRFINRLTIPGLHYSGRHGQEGLVDIHDTLIQNRIPLNGQFLDYPYLHTTHLSRTTPAYAQDVPLRKAKFKYELGIKFPQDFAYPESFYLPAPKPVPSPWTRLDPGYFFISLCLTPLKILKRALTP